MSAISREEIERIVDSCCQPIYAGEDAEQQVGQEITEEGAVVACSRVAALVEQRMKEMVCSVCGKVLTDEGLNGFFHGEISFSCVEGDWRSVTRAQYESEREER